MKRNKAYYRYKRKLIELLQIDFHTIYWYSKAKKYTKEDFANAINNNNFKIVKKYDKFTIYKSNGNTFIKDERHIPILKEIGISDIVSHLDIYNSLEEYFSEEKSDSEKTEPNGMTNENKIESHGFDVKESFRRNK